MEGVEGVEGNKTIMEEDEETYDDLEEGLEQHEVGAVGKDIEKSHSYLQHGATVSSLQKTSSPSTAMFPAAWIKG